MQVYPEYNVTIPSGDTIKVKVDDQDMYTLSPEKVIFADIPLQTTIKIKSASMNGAKISAPQYAFVRATSSGGVGLKFSVIQLVDILGLFDKKIELVLRFTNTTTSQTVDKTYVLDIKIER